MTIVIIIVAVLFVIFMLFILGVFKSPAKKDDTKEQGKITQTADDYDPSLEFVAQSEDEAGIDVNIVSIENTKIVYDLLSLQAIQKLRPSLTNFLLMQGYDEETIVYLKIDESTVSEDRSYPYFELFDTNDTDTVIQCHYDLDKYEWNIHFK